MSASYPPPRPGPHVDPSELRPRRRWYVIGAGVIVGLFATGVVGFLVMILTAVELPEFDAEVDGTDEVVFSLPAPEANGHRLSLYASPNGADPDACVLGTPEGEAEFGRSGTTHEVTAGAESWELVGETGNLEAGEYTLSCEGEEGTTYAVTHENVMDGVFSGVLGALGFAFVPPLLGLLLGVPILIVTAVRRDSHKRRLLGERLRGGY